MRINKKMYNLRSYLSRKQITLLFSLLLLIAFPVLLLAVHMIYEIRQRAAGSSIPSLSHAFVIIMENHSESQITGNIAAPYINQLISKYGYAANYIALFHPSLPNYIALTSGGNQGITSDCDSCRVSAPSIFDELEKAGKTWKAYMESMPSNCAGSDAGPYLHHHNPPAYYSSLLNSGSCSKNDVPYTQFSSDLSSGNVANFVFISPDANNDMHNGTIQQGDTWLSQEVPKILASSAYQQNGLLVITWDEGSKNANPNQVVTIVISPLGLQGFTSTVAYNHYSLLRTISDGLGIQPLGGAASTPPMTDFFAVGNPSPTVTPGPCVIPSMTPGVTPTPVPSQSGVSPTTQPPTGKAPYVQGTQIINPTTGKPFLLRGAQIPSELNIGWVNGSKVATVLNPQVFAAMRNWNMNVLRLPIGAYNYQKPNYMNILDQVVGQANAAGLYVILGNFEDAQAGGGNSLLDQQGLTMWQFLAGHYKNNSMVMFDLINEPKNPNWNSWLNGGNGIIGYNAAIAAIRTVGAQQIIVAQSGQSGGGKTGWATYPGGITDPNVIYNLHFYEQVALGNPTVWNQAWGPILGKNPIYFGEWAMLANPNYPIFCQGVTSANADQVTNTFLTYMDSVHANWTAWAFNPSHLIVDDTSFTPTTFQTDAPWTCPNGVGAGMGADLKNYLATVANTQTASSFATKKTPTPTCPLPSTFPSDTPTFGPTSGSSPTAQSFCGQTCNTNADCDQSGVTCGVCDPDAKVCRQGNIPSTTDQPTQSLSPQPSGAPTIPAGAPIGSVSVHFEGIDPQNNQTPHHPQRLITLSFYTTQNFTQPPVATINTIVTFSSSDTNGAFINMQIDLSSVPFGTYYVLVKSPEGSLQELLNQQPISIAKGTSLSLNGTSTNASISPQNLRMGDLNNDNIVDLTDYNIIVDCYGKKSSTTNCTNHNIVDQTKGLFADFNDDSIVNGIDYNILLRNFGQNGYGASTSAQ